MQLRNILTVLVSSVVVWAAYLPHEPWSTLSPTGSMKDGVINHYSVFGIMPEPVTANLHKRNEVTQIEDGQVQIIKTKNTRHIITVTKTTTNIVTKTLTPTTSKKHTLVSQITDGQIQMTKTSTQKTKETSSTKKEKQKKNKDKVQDIFKLVACKTNDALQITLVNKVLTDNKGRIGCIVANRQFQFDGPPPQAGTIYASGWSITPDGNLALGGKDIFYQCLADNFYNLYDQHIGSKCEPIHLRVVSLIDC
ncbi:hypothetical protein NCAS_0I02820 [Naumovozyma castellii]|uniref:Cell wall mannoprotein PIR1-like C-terminal domain-containing protein n=1 Tax=Naumovozyma castellii TaxID=27288 RepID=G0VKB6_NAUCA|nr:hypothetical protein NCAS_0I02820 [Naumovozyma castellii CBS 4309]CCC71950.1 hypothetical protein NCAS_0I02820 [Naumovozyma castellii CBS 4309]